MERFILLNLQSDSVKAENANLSKPASQEPAVFGKALKEVADKAAHKAAGKFARSGAGLFSK